jgi:hypothetical protein
MYERDTWRTLNLPSDVLQNGSNTLEFTIKNQATTGDNYFILFNDSYITGLDFDVKIILPKSTKMSIGGSLTYQISITNHQGTPDTFTLAITGIDSSWFSIDKTYIIHPDVTKRIPLKVSIPDTALACVFPIKVHVTSSNTGMTRNAMAPLTVVNEPIISNLLPADNAHIGSRDVVFSWNTPVNCTTQVYIKGENEMDYSGYKGSSGISHAVTVINLTRNEWYRFYVVSSSPHGTATSETRDVFIDNGISFDRKAYNFNIERDYDQRATISVTNRDNKPHKLLLTVNNPYDDLIVGFIGDGSMDQIVTLDPSERACVTLAIHAQDVLQEDYRLLLNLTNLGEENIQDFAYADIHVHIPHFDFTLEEVSSDPYTLTKRLRIRNHGDVVSDLSVSASDELRGKVVFNPAIDHLRLRTRETVEFDVIPALSADFVGANGTIQAQGADTIVDLSTDFTVPSGKKVFIGHIPNVTIEFPELYDLDGSPDTNPSGDKLVTSYIVNNTKIFLSQIIIRVCQDGDPVCYSNISLTFWNATSQMVSHGVSDRYGYVVFTLHGPVDDYSYKAGVVEYNVTTETRNFYVNETPKCTITSSGISWVSISDSDSTFDLTGGPSGPIELDNSPFTFRATKDTIEENTTAILYLQSNTPLDDLPPELLQLSMVRIEGEIIGNEIQFNAEMVPLGDYTASIISYSPSEMIISDRINLTFSDRYEDKAVNYSVRVPFPINSTHMRTLYVDHHVLKRDPNEFINLCYVRSGDLKSDSNSTSEITATQTKDSKLVYNITYVITATQTMDDTILIEVRDEDNTTIYQDTQPVHLEPGTAHPIIVHFPVTSRGKFTVSISTSHTSISTSVDGICHEIGAAETWDELFGANPFFSAPFTPTIPLKGMLKCAVGFTNLGTAMGFEGYLTNVLNARTMSSATSITATYALKTAVHLHPVGNFLLNAHGCLNDVMGVAYKAPYSGEGLMYSYGLDGWYCNNRPEIVLLFDLLSALKNLLDPSRDPYLVIHFSLPWDSDAYRPHDVHVSINDMGIGDLENTIPEGHYIFDFDSSKLNFAEKGAASNMVTLVTEHMNGGHYVVSSDMRIVMHLRDIEMPVVATNQTEADEIVRQISGTMKSLPDFGIYTEDIRFSNSEPVEGEMIEINATIYNLGTMNSEVLVQMFGGDTLIGEQFVFLPLLDSKSVDFTWSSAEGSHKIHALVNPDKTIQEPDYTNNDAYRDIFVYESSDVTPPTITNVTAAEITANSAMITWDTDEPGDSLIMYGIESGNYTMMVGDPTSTYVINHRIILNGLSENTTYYYVANSTDIRSNSAQSTEYHFMAIAKAP